MKLSVIVAARSGSRPSFRCLESLRAVPLWGSFEVIVVNCLAPEAAGEIDGFGAGVTVVSADSRWSIARQREAGVRRAGGDIIAILHERYQITPGWVEAVFRAHAEGCDVVGGSVTPGGGLSSAAWAMYLSEYSHLCPPMDDGSLDTTGAAMLPGGNVSYKKSVFALTDMAAALWELDFHAALFVAGARFFRVHAMQAVFATPYSLQEFVAERYAVSRDLANRQAGGLNHAQRYVAAGTRVVLPALVAGRVAARLFVRGAFRMRFVLVLPWILFFGAVQAVGEIVGYLSAGRSVGSASGARV